MIPLQNMINALYSKDISRKVSTALKAQMEQGTFQKRNLPYGYRWNEEHTNMVIDEETASYVRLIFQRKIEGWSMPMSTMLITSKFSGSSETSMKIRRERNECGGLSACSYGSTDQPWRSQRSIGMKQAVHGWLSTYERLVKSQNFFSSYLTQEDLSRMGRTKFSISKYLFQ